MYVEQLNEGQPFSDLQQTITINILDFVFTETENYISVFHLREDVQTDYMLTDVMEIRFIELPKFRKQAPDLSNPLDRWMVFLDNSPEEVLNMAIKQDSAIAEAQKLLAYLGTNEEIKRYYDLREKAIHDEITRINGGPEQKAKKEARKGVRKKARKRALRKTKLKQQRS